MSHFLNPAPITPAPSACEIPATDLLMAEAMASAHKDFSTSVYYELQTSRRSDAIYIVACVFAFFLAFMKREKHILRMFRAGKSYLVSLLTEQIARNTRIDPDHLEHELQSRILRRFNQLPCTPKTLDFRVQTISRYCSHSDPILIVGDDDLLSAALCKAGFSNVTAIDIDQAVLQQIVSKTAHYSTKPKVMARDISLGLADEHINAFKLVVTDPPCTVEGLTLFFKAAASALNQNIDSHLMLCTHLLSQTDEGLKNLRRLKEDGSLVTEETLMATSIYPFPGELRILIKFLLRICEFTVMRHPQHVLSKNTPNYFVSDTVIFKRARTQCNETK